MNYLTGASPYHENEYVFFGTYVKGLFYAGNESVNGTPDNGSQQCIIINTT